MATTTTIISIPMAFAHIAPNADDLVRARCLHCDSPLELHQPECDDPERLIGTCGECGAWSLLSWEPGHDRGVLLMLPDQRTLHRAAADP